MTKVEAKSHAYYEQVVAEDIEAATDPVALKMPKANTVVSREAQRFALLRAAYNKSKKLYDESRLKLLSMHHIPPEPGKVLLVDTPQVALNAVVTAPRHTLNEDALVACMIEQFDIDEQRARDIIDFCKLPGDPVVKLEVTLKK